MSVVPTQIVTVELSALDHMIRSAVTDALAAATQQPVDNDALLNVKDAADLVGSTPTALRVAIQRGKLDDAVVRLGRSVRLRRRELIAAFQPKASA